MALKSDNYLQLWPSPLIEPSKMAVILETSLGDLTIDLMTDDRPRGKLCHDIGN